MSLSPFIFRCASCNAQCRALHILIAISGPLSRRKHFCSVACAHLWLGPG